MFVFVSTSGPLVSCLPAIPFVHCAGLFASGATAAPLVAMFQPFQADSTETLWCLLKRELVDVFPAGAKGAMVDVTCQTKNVQRDMKQHI